MLLSGKYQLERNCHFYEHLVAVGIAEDKAKIVDALKPVLEISVEKDRLTLISHNGLYRNKSELVFNEEVDETLGFDSGLKSVAKIVDDSTIEIESRANASGDIGRRRLEISEQNLIMTIENDSKSIPVAKRYYKRLED